MSGASQQLLDIFIDHLWLEDGLARNTLDSYRLDLAQFALWIEKHAGKDLALAERVDIEKYLAFKFPTSKPRSRSEEHTSELQSLMRISYAVFCLKKKKK